MRSRRVLLVVFLLLALVAAACANDAGQPTSPTTGGESEAASEPAAGSESESASESAGGTGEALVALDDLCAQEFADVQAPEGFKIRLVTDIGQVDDGTFNQFAYEGMTAAAECFGVSDTGFIETVSQADYARNIQAVLDDQPNLVVTVGFLIATDTLAFAQSNPDVSFVGVDQFQPEFPDNYAGVLFAEDEAGFIAGAMAALLSESGTVAVIGGREDVPPVVRYVNGYSQGAAQVDSGVNVLQVYIPSFTDQAAGASAAQQFLGEDADVIFGAGGQTGSGGIRAAAAEGAWVIGVDQDEYLTTFQNGTVPGADRLATSAIKRVDLGVFTQIAAAIQGSFAGGAQTYNAENGGVTYAPFHDAQIPDDVASQIEEIRVGLADGSITTGVDPATGQITG